jgi:hypothetical protein
MWTCSYKGWFMHGVFGVDGVTVQSPNLCIWGVARSRDSAEKWIRQLVRVYKNLT